MNGAVMEQEVPFNLKAIFNKLVDIDRIIELVKVRPVIWDKTVEGYRNKDICIPAWEQVFMTVLDSYDSLGEEQKKYFGKLIKQKWTTARDQWQRSHKKRREAMQNGENKIDWKDQVRYDKLKFLARVYDREEELKECRGGKISDQKQGNIECPPSPQEDLDEERFLKNPEFERNMMDIFMKQRTSQNMNIFPKKRKLEHSNVNIQDKNEQGTSSHHPLIVNVEDKVSVNNLINVNRRISSSDSREANKSIYNTFQTPKRGQLHSSPLKDEKLSTQQNCLSEKNDPNQIPQNLVSRSPSWKESFSGPSSLSTKKIKCQITEDNDPEHDEIEIKVEKPISTPPKGSNSSNTELDNFLQLTLKPRIAELNEVQMMDFFHEILKCRIDKHEMMDIFLDILKPFVDKNRFLDFQIEALQLVKKKQENQET